MLYTCLGEALFSTRQKIWSNLSGGRPLNLHNAWAATHFFSPNGNCDGLTKKFALRHNILQSSSWSNGVREIWQNGAVEIKWYLLHDYWKRYRQYAVMYERKAKEKVHSSSFIEDITSMLPWKSQHEILLIMLGC